MTSHSEPSQISLRINVDEFDRTFHGTSIRRILISGCTSLVIGERRREQIENAAWQRALDSGTTSFSFRALGTRWECEIQ